MAEAEFMKIGAAYEILNDDELRGKYDRGEDVSGQGQGGGGHGPPGHHMRHGNFHFHFRN